MESVTPSKLPAGKALPSIVALACGMRENGSINIIGTGFGVGTSIIDKNRRHICYTVNDYKEQFRFHIEMRKEPKKI